MRLTKNKNSSICRAIITISRNAIHVYLSLIHLDTSIRMHRQYNVKIHQSKHAEMTQIARFMGPTWGPPLGPRWAQWCPHEPCYQGSNRPCVFSDSLRRRLIARHIDCLIGDGVCHYRRRIQRCLVLFDSNKYLCGIYANTFLAVACNLWRVWY